MSAKTPENVIVRAIHEAFIKYPEGDGGPNLDYQWIQPEQSGHIAKAHFRGAEKPRIRLGGRRSLA